jgi:putative DNA primase/helicase
VITERLLSISGGDPQHISRKYKDHLTGYNLPVRFTLFSNLLPKIKDASGAFTSRCLFLRMPSSHLGREDFGLRDRLLSELPGILNWAIIGRHYLDREQRLHQPKQASILVDDMRELVNPVADFLETACEQDASFRVETKDLFKLWERWCMDNDLAHPGNIQSFCRKVKGVSMLESRRQVESGVTKRVFHGLRPKKEFMY